MKLADHAMDSSRFSKDRPSAMVADASVSRIKGIKGARVELNCRLTPCRQRRLLTTMKIQFDRGPFDS
jgi:hypothetical protein